MTPDAHRPRDSSIDFAADIDLLAGLWQEAPFARLPTDAPPEVKAAVQNVENPARVYAIHQASRRHGFQLLVERYIIQLRSGCDNVNCATPTCFTCRRRLAGKAPIRRYNTTSARTLAIYLASQDDPEKGLCPFLRKSPEPPAALSNLIFSTRPSSPPHPDDKRANVATSPGVRKSQAARPRPTSSASQDSIHSAKRASRSTDGSSVSWVHVTEGPVNKDHRSFAANLFGTVAFKMLEWLTPKGVAAMSEKLGSLEVTDSRASATDTDTLQESSSSTSTSTDLEMHKVLSHESSAPRSIKTADQSQQTDWDEPPFPTKSCRSRHGSTHKSQNNATPNPRKRSSDSNDFIRGEDGNKVTQLPQGNGHLREKSLRPRSSKHAAVPNMREIPSKPGLFENVTKPAAEPVLSSPPLTSRHNAVNEAKSKSDGSDQGARNDILSQETSRSEAESEAVAFHGSDSILPQALSKLDVDLVNFICDVYESDGTSEASLTPTSKMHYRYPQPVDQREGLRRHPASRTARSRKQWLHFNEQTIFYVLTDPQAVVQSFTQGHKLYDSQTLWYCFHRLSRVTSSLVFHSLWLAAAHLFIPPCDLKSSSSLKQKDGQTFRKGPGALSDSEAGYLMSICMHALVAATPVVSDSRTLYELSRARSNGLTLAGGSAISRQPSSRCLDYDDAFSNDLTIRLARRLFCAITARRCFADKTRSAGHLEDLETNDGDILQPLVGQLDFLSTGSASILEFPRDERLLHETRVPTVLLDWARTVLLNEWDGQADFAMDGPFGGALAFIETLRRCKS